MIKITPEQMLKAVKRAEPLTPELEAIAQETMKKLKSLSSEEILELFDEEES